MVPKIFQGDDTDANGRTVAIQLPDEDMSGFRMRFEFLGRTFEFDELPRGGSVRVDFDADDTALFPLGTHYGTIRLQKNGRWHTVSNTVPVTVSDEVGAVYGGDASAIHLEMQFCGGIPDLTGVNDSPANANELARAFKALLDALKGAPRSLGMLALAFCMSAFGASARLTVQSAPLGEIAFSSRVVTGVDFDERGLVTRDEITDVVRENVLKSMSWTNANYVASVLGIVNPLFMSDEFSGLVEGAVEGRFFSSTGGVIRSKGGALPTFKLANAYNDDGAVGFWDGLWRFGAQSWFDVDESVPLLHVEPVGSGYGVIEVVGHTGPASITKDGVEVVTEYDLNVLSNALANASGKEDAFYAWRTNDNQVALGNSSTVSASKGMAIGLKTTTGRTTIAAGASSIAFGIGAQTASAGAAAIAFGANATANASSAVQIGQGVNSEAETLQFRSYRLLNADGTIPAERLGAAVTAETVTNVVERVRDLIYDEKRNITWRRVMYDGNLYYVAVTNANIVAEED